jgi:hypothetical protein
LREAAGDDRDPARGDRDGCRARPRALRGVALSGLDLGGACLIGADLRDADLRDADLREADLSDADLRGADLRGADLRDAFLAGARLDGARLQGADLRDAYLAETDLGRVDLAGVDLRGADMEKFESLADEPDEQLADEGVPPASPSMPPPARTAAARRLPALGSVSAGTTLPVRLGEELPARYAVRLLAGATAAAGAACATIVALTVRASVAEWWPRGPLDGLGWVITLVSLLSGPAVAIFLTAGFMSLLVGPLLRQLRAGREEGVTIVEVARETLAPGARAELYVELSRRAVVERVTVRLLCVEVVRRNTSNLRRIAVIIPLCDSGPLALPPGTPWRRSLTLRIPRDARRHDFAPDSRVWVGWLIEVVAHTPGGEPRARNFPLRVE